MKVAIVTSSFPRYKGDHAGVFLYDLARNLVEEGLDIHVLAPHDKSFPQEEQWQGINIHRFRYVPNGLTPVLCYGHGISDNLKQKRTAYFQVPLYSASLFLALGRLVHQKGIQIVNSHWLLMQGVSAALLHTRIGLPHLCTIHSSEVSLLSRLPIGRQLAKFTLMHSDHVVCVSNKTCQRLEAVVDTPVEATILPMGVDISHFQSKLISRQSARQTIGLDSRNVLLFIGRLVEVKGINYLLQALPAVKSRIGDLKLLIIGTGNLETELKEQVSQLGLQDLVKFVGHVPHKDLPVYYRAANVVVVPSVILDTGEQEGMPVVILEALAAGCRVVATRAGGSPEIIRDGENGFLANPADEDSLAQAIQRALLMPHNDDFEKAIKKAVSPYDWPAIAGSYRQIIEQLINGSRPVGA